MKVYHIFLVAILIACTAWHPAYADDLTPVKQADIEHLLNMTGALQLGRQFSEALSIQMIRIVKSAHPEIPQKLLDNIPADIDAVISRRMSGLERMLVKLYAKYFTDGEIKQLINFYSTPIGQKTIKTMPILMREGMMLGQQWGRALSPEIQQRIRNHFKSEGIIL
jgi:uncharacterized protein